jgi:hypothetical protein
VLLLRLDCSGGGWLRRVILEMIIKCTVTVILDCPTNPVKWTCPTASAVFSDENDNDAVGEFGRLTGLLFRRAPEIRCQPEGRRKGFELCCLS